ncbi:hypothetical protein NECAME_03308 [Necator americanus]|uniref:Uncharacterized protein n=1 Tax=Necator americanus TaxID=51031 RepID=W2T5K3_NECAM|nr:hypothetical protein NECAME_03308 [Necator americanus]ETN76879.1 hypothetical protein NECAME_03308 [Necator americanus]
MYTSFYICFGNRRLQDAHPHTSFYEKYMVMVSIGGVHWWRTYHMNLMNHHKSKKLSALFLGY